MDLTKINQPFGTLDIETKLALHRAYYEGKAIQRKHRLYREEEDQFIEEYEQFLSVTGHGFDQDGIYRVAPPPQRDIQVPWHVFGPEVQWAARDEDECVVAYCGNKPDRVSSQWLPDTDDWFRIDNLHLIGFDPGNKPWDQSLVRRPEVV